MKRLQKLVIVLLIFFTMATLFARERDEKKNLLQSADSIKYEYLFSNPIDAINKLLPLLKSAKDLKYEFAEASVYAKLSLAYRAKGGFDKSIEYSLKAITIYEKLNAIDELIGIYGEYGYFMKNTDIQSSRKYMQLAIKFAEKFNKKQSLAKLYDNYGSVCEISNQLDSALIFYKKGLKLKYELNDSHGIPYSLNHLAGIYAVLGLYKKAFEKMRESDKYRAKEKGGYGRAENTLNYGDLFLSIGKIDSAKYYFRTGLKLSKQLSNKHMTSYCYKQLSDIYQRQGNYKRAYNNFKQYKAYSDSIINFETNKTIAELQINYETAKKDNKIYKSELALKEKSNQLRLAVGIVFILLIITLAIYKFQIMKRKRIREELELKNKLKKAEYEQKINAEKLRISRELHDNIGSQLTFLISSLDNFSYLKKKIFDKDKIKSLSSFARNTLSELRNTIWAMKSEDGNIQDLVLKLNEIKVHFVEYVPGLSIEIENNTNNNYKLSSIQMLNILRIIQEALQNTIKYAGADNFSVLFENTDSHLKIVIKDDGKGLDVSKGKNGNGLKNMKYRAEKAGGEVSISSSPKGTEIICSIKLI